MTFEVEKLEDGDGYLFGASRGMMKLGHQHLDNGTVGSVFETLQTDGKNDMKQDATPETILPEGENGVEWGTTLEMLKVGSRAIVKQLRGGQCMRQRLGNMGLHEGDPIRVVQSGALGGPILVEIHGAEVAIGRGMARQVEVEVELKVKP